MVQKMQKDINKKFSPPILFCLTIVKFLRYCAGESPHKHKQIWTHS